MTRISLVCAVSLFLPFASSAFATTIDFESQGSAAPTAFNGHLNSPLTVGIATFSGGELLRNVSGAADATAVYATTNLVSGGYQDPLTIAFSQPVSALSLVLTNEIPDTYSVTANAGTPTSSFVNANTSQTLNAPGTLIQSISIFSSQTFEWDFAIDNVSFTAAVVAPESATASSLVIAGIALCSLSLLRSRRRGRDRT